MMTQRSPSRTPEPARLLARERADTRAERAERLEILESSGESHRFARGSNARGSKDRAMTIRYHDGDLPDLSRYTDSVAIDTETMGLHTYRDRLCVVQLSPGDGSADVVRIALGQKSAPNLQRLLADPKVVKIFHFARFDLAALYHWLGVMPEPVWCTKIASKLVRTYTDRHGLKDLARDLVGVEISKQQQSSDWGAEALSEAQIAYAASDVLYLHQIRDKLAALLAREGRTEIAEACFRFLPTKARLDLIGWAEADIFDHA
jgi:ribonuclease D